MIKQIIPLTARRAAAELGRFAREQDASITIESLIVLPFFLQFYIASYVFFDMFRMATINEKAAYTIADVISRRNPGADVDQDYIDGLNTLFDYLIDGRGATWIRVTSVVFSGANDRYEVEWSATTGGYPVLNTGIIQSHQNFLPVMPDGDTVVLVETNTTFQLNATPVFGGEYLFGVLGERELETYIFTRPRFAPRIGFESS
jgi:hypothetical protein